MKHTRKSFGVGLHRVLTPVRHIHIQGDHNNNKMERLNGEVRDREKVMRGIKKMDSPIFKGYQLYHNTLGSMTLWKEKHPLRWRILRLKVETSGLLLSKMDRNL